MGLCPYRRKGSPNRELLPGAGKPRRTPLPHGYDFPTIPRLCGHVTEDVTQVSGPPFDFPSQSPRTRRTRRRVAPPLASRLPGAQSAATGRPDLIPSSLRARAAGHVVHGAEPPPSRFPPPWCPERSHRPSPTLSSRLPPPWCPECSHRPLPTPNLEYPSQSRRIRHTRCRTAPPLVPCLPGAQSAATGQPGHPRTPLPHFPSPPPPPALSGAPSLRFRLPRHTRFGSYPLSLLSPPPDAVPPSFLGCRITQPASVCPPVARSAPRA